MGTPFMKSADSDKDVFFSIRSGLPDSLVPMYLAYRYGMLLVFLGLFGWLIKLFLNCPPGDWDDPYRNIVGWLMLLLNHLAFFFEWRRRVGIVLCVAAVIWTLFGLFYIVYLSQLLYPSP